MKNSRQVEVPGTVLRVRAGRPCYVGSRAHIGGQTSTGERRLYNLDNNRVIITPLWQSTIGKSLPANALRFLAGLNLARLAIISARN